MPFLDGRELTEAQAASFRGWLFWLALYNEVQLIFAQEEAAKAHAYVERLRAARATDEKHLVEVGGEPIPLEMRTRLVREFLASEHGKKLLARHLDVETVSEGMRAWAAELQAEKAKDDGSVSGA